MRIAYFIDHLRGDGAQRYLGQLATGMADRGYQQVIFCLNDSYDAKMVARLEAAGVDVHIVGRGRLITGRGLWSTYAFLCHGRYEVVVTFLFFGDIIGRSLARAAGIPHIISSIQNRNMGYRLWQRRLARHTMRWVDCTVLNSANLRDSAISEEGATADRICVIPNAIRTQDYNLSVMRSEVLDELGLKAEQLIVGSIGRLIHQKGFDFLFKAMSRLDQPNLHLVLIGTGELERALRAEAIELGLDTQVHFAGYRRDVPRLLQILDLYVQPSRHEGMPNALLEAMASGRAIVATAVDGNQELIEDGIHGWLVPPEDVDALANAIEAALADRAEAHRRAVAARQHAEEYSIESLLAKWEQVFRGVLP